MAEPPQAAKIRFKRGIVLREDGQIFGGDDLTIGSRSSEASHRQTSEPTAYRIGIAYSRNAQVANFCDLDDRLCKCSKHDRCQTVEFREPGR